MLTWRVIVQLLHLISHQPEVVSEAPLENAEFEIISYGTCQGSRPSPVSAVNDIRGLGITWSLPLGTSAVSFGMVLFVYSNLTPTRGHPP